MNEIGTHPVKKKPSGGGRALHSRLEQFVDFIRDQRQRRKTWKETAALLSAVKGCPISAQGVHQFYRRYLTRQARPHWERDAVTTEQSSAPTQKSVLAATPNKTTNPYKFNTEI